MVLIPISPPAVTACDHGMPISQHTGAMIQPSSALQRQRRAEKIRQQPEHGVGEVHQRDEHDQHGDDVEQKLEAGAGALDDGVHGAAGDLLDVAERAAGVRLGRAPAP